MVKDVYSHLGVVQAARDGNLGDYDMVAVTQKDEKGS